MCGGCHECYPGIEEPIEEIEAEPTAPATVRVEWMARDLYLATDLLDGAIVEVYADSAPFAALLAGEHWGH